MLRRDCTDLSELTRSACNVSRKLVEKPFAAVGTVPGETVRGVRLVRSVRVRICFWQ